ncbi:hypothetical protein AMECASPLE_015511 [Ameca splendens]|uniref:Secreted protein n=1 Tax=Ameca splendens TaxID=208324 RepID=A0ABV0XQR0_9TELE
MFFRGRSVTDYSQSLLFLLLLSLPFSCVTTAQALFFSATHTTTTGAESKNTLSAHRPGAAHGWLASSSGL